MVTIITQMALRGALNELRLLKEADSRVCNRNQDMLAMGEKSSVWCAAIVHYLSVSGRKVLRTFKQDGEWRALAAFDSIFQR